MFSENVIFMDGEFTGLSEKGTQFVSLALVKPTGESLYLINSEYNGKKCTGWVKENVLTPLYIETVSGDNRNVLDIYNFNKRFGIPEKEIARKISEFVGEYRPFMVADVNQFDWMGICGLFGVYGVPFHYIPIDFSTILFQQGYDPDIDRAELARSLGVNVENYKKHSALGDAEVLKGMWENLEKIKIYINKSN
jgi:hypothetical protein